MIRFKVHERFNSTIQGEGYWAGSLCDFIRLYGCPVGCPWCDTGYATGSPGISPETLTLESLVSGVESERVVISGGEPFIQSHLQDLVSGLRIAQHRVSVETSGTFYQPIEGAWITLSPKEHVSSHKTDSRMWGLCSEVKIVVETLEDFERYIEQIPQNTPTYVQPCWRDGVANIEPVMQVLKKYQHVKASFQIHKLVGLA